MTPHAPLIIHADISRTPAHCRAACGEPDQPGWLLYRHETGFPGDLVRRQYLTACPDCLYAVAVRRALRLDIQEKLQVLAA